MADKSNGHIRRENVLSINVGMLPKVEKGNVNVRSDNPQQKEKIEWWRVKRNENGL